MTEERMALLEFVRKSGEPDLLRELLQFTVQRLMDAAGPPAMNAARTGRTAGMATVSASGRRAWARSS
jgi:hypothetical protein